MREVKDARSQVQKLVNQQQQHEIQQLVGRSSACS